MCLLRAALGGSLTVRSRAGDGTRFTANIPVALEERADGADGGMPPSPAASSDSRRSSGEEAGTPSSPRTPASRTVLEEEDTGLLPYLPPQAQQAQAQGSDIVKNGRLQRDAMDLVRPLRRAGIIAGVVSECQLTHANCAARSCCKTLPTVTASEKACAR